MQMGTRLPFCKNQEKGGLGWQTSRSESIIPTTGVEAPSKMTPTTYRSLKHQLTNTRVRQNLANNGKQRWRELNTKYKLDCFSDSELDSKSDEGEQYHYEHGYETLI